ncbi:AGC protein kinase [Phytophthora nicotianae P1976]|uniref:AGC protein kinase n=1 Tax=Phytophthora nicotianae P1976 TaxID=1317066 RepID=A0A081AFP2_PHYNI|nr:AGC protein kinase [Phytophthora nicotianae P1976]
MAPIFPPLKNNTGTRTSGSKSSKALDYKKWGNVKTWTFAQLLASSFAKVSLEDAMKNGGNSPTVKNNSKKPISGNNDWDCSYSCLKPPSAVSSSSSTVPSESDTKSSGNNDWDCSYSGLKPVASRPMISASSSSSTLLSDAEMNHLRHSIEELLEHEETVEEGSEEEGRDPTRYVFDIVRIIGSGSYGTVLLCRLRACPNRLFAVKVVYKSKLSSINGLDGDRNTSREARRLLTEKKVLCSVNHPFITKMYCSFETPDALNFVLEYCPGGDMYFLLENFAKNRLPEDHVLFYAASIALALRYLHERGILYRDLKPENILLDEAGFLRLADFGFARERMNRSEQSCKSFCGSADYIAPEVVRGDGYGLAADLWSFGCVVYELLTGYPPFYSPRDRASLFRKIEEDEPSFPTHFSPDLCDFISGLLHKDANQRLGNGPNGMQEIFDHSFFANISWHRLETKQVAPPIVPKLASELDTSNFEDQFTSQQVEGHLVYEEREPQGTLSDEEETSFYFGDFDWCADASHFQ